MFLYGISYVQFPEKNTFWKSDSRIFIGGYIKCMTYNFTLYFFQLISEKKILMIYYM